MGKRVIDQMLEEIMACFAPPPDMTVSEWAEENRILSTETGSSTGRWKNEKAPYQKPIMDAFTQRGVERIVVVSGAQCGKSEVTMNMMARCIDLDPAPMMMVQPSQQTAEEFSKQRIASMVDCCPVLKEKVAESKSRVSSNTIRLKSFPGGSLVIASGNSATELRSKPIKYLFLDEVDAYPPSVGGDGDPVELAIARTETFYNRKIVMVSTPTEENRSSIWRAYKKGTQEEWCLPCPQCGEYQYLKFADFVTETEEYEAGGVSQTEIKSVQWRCPNCQSLHTESEMRRTWQAGKYIARNERALKKGVRSFHLNAFSSPWASWKKIMQQWTDASGNPEKEQVFLNNRLGEPWKRKAEQLTTPDEIYKRREEYSAEVPDGVLVLTMGVDTQDNRLEYEVIGWGREFENWHIMRGIIPGRPDHPSEMVWKELDALLDRGFKRADGKKMRILTTFIDSGGHHTETVYKQCAKRVGRRVFAIKGEGGADKEYIRMSSAMKNNRGIILFILGVDSGKEKIVYSLNTEKPGPYYSHFPADPTAGYTKQAISGLFSEKMILKTTKGLLTPAWVRNEKIQARNEPLDCTNYAQAAFMAFKIDLDAIERKLKGEIVVQKARKRGVPHMRKIDDGITI